MAADLMQFAAEQQQQFNSVTTTEERKQRGHFGTPASIAGFMAGMFSDLSAGDKYILDPGAGVGMLSAAVCQQVLDQGSRSALRLELWENDPLVLPYLKATVAHCQSILHQSGHQVEFVIRDDDFILSNGQATLFSNGSAPRFNVAILNPPYFKLRKDSPHAANMEHIVHGQPNIYSIFMATAADLLLPGGEMVAITPRSYFNGLYFRRFRNWFFDRLAARHVHIFESRTAAFKEGAVLQENVILRADKAPANGKITLTTSMGRDLTAIRTSVATYDRVVDNRNGDRLIRVTTTREDEDVVARIDALDSSLSSLGLRISTGPVVAFRAAEFLRDERAHDTAPLLWMSNVRPFVTLFPQASRKPAHIEASESSRKLLLPAKTYVLLKRFTAKEEKRRLVAGIVTREDSYADWIGLENHLNYICRPHDELSIKEARALAAYFNSAIVDRYFRAISGSTQVNAREIRSMPLPDEHTLQHIGNELSEIDPTDLTAIERIIGTAIRLPQRRIDELVAVPQ